jgi:hypothetical protein
MFSLPRVRMGSDKSNCIWMKLLHQECARGDSLQKSLRPVCTYSFIFEKLFDSPAFMELQELGRNYRLLDFEQYLAMVPPGSLRRLPQTDCNEDSCSFATIGRRMSPMSHLSRGP